MNCENCGGDSGPYRMHPDPAECVSRLMGERDRLAAELVEANHALGVYEADLDSAHSYLDTEREAHARTKAERDGSMALLDHYRIQAETFHAMAVEQQTLSIKRRDQRDRAEAVIAGLRAWLRACCGDDLTSAEVDGKLDELEREVEK